MQKKLNLFISARKNILLITASHRTMLALARTNKKVFQVTSFWRW